METRWLEKGGGANAGESQSGSIASELAASLMVPAAGSYGTTKCLSKSLLYPHSTLAKKDE